MTSHITLKADRISADNVNTIRTTGGNVYFAPLTNGTMSRKPSRVPATRTLTR